jgi:hypothetical protein
MTTLTLSLNLQPAVDRALRGAVTQLGTAIQTGFDQQVYGWPVITKRRSGELAGTVRDVVDRGTLKGSQTAPFQVRPGVWAIEWTTPYANAVFLGAVLKGRKGALPARNVPMNTVASFDLSRAFLGAWK